MPGVIFQFSVLGTIKSVLKVFLATQQVDLDLNWKFKTLFMGLKGHIIRTPRSLSTKLNTTYQVKDSPQEIVSLELEAGDKSVGAIVSYQLEYRMLSSEFPRFNNEVGTKLLVSNMLD